MKHINGEDSMKLLVIADDFTGALDTGVQFAGQGIPTQILHQPAVTQEELAEAEAEVLVIDAETRHLDDKQAYKTVYEIVMTARRASVPYIYKKTDSGLRGNIGAELQAALDASGMQYLTFIPALPAMNRITVNGIHYIDKVPVQDSVFGTDLFNPVLTSNVKELFRKASCPVRVYRAGEKRQPARGQEIGIFDAGSQEDIVRIVTDLSQRGLMGVMAGCTGFASVLADHLSLKREQEEISFTANNLFILCGSINEISKRQIEYAERNGIRRVTMNPYQLDSDYLESREGKRWLLTLKEICDGGTTCVVETGISDIGQVRSYMQERGISLEASRVRIADALGVALKMLLQMGMNATVMIIGGDTLNGFFRQIHAREIVICREMGPGTVLSFIRLKDERQWIISKSGGFGRPELLVDIEKKVKGGILEHEAGGHETSGEDICRFERSGEYLQDCEGKIS